MDPAMEAVGQEEEIQIIQPALHPVEAVVQVSIYQEEESDQEEDPPMVIQGAAVSIRLHLHLQVQRHRCSQEEQDSPVAIQELQHHLHSHLQASVQLKHGHHLTDLGRLCQSYSYPRTTKTATSWICSKCSRIGATSRRHLARRCSKVSACTDSRTSSSSTRRMVIKPSRSKSQS